MRRYLLVLPFVFACAKGEEAPADSAAMAAPALTEADVAGSWSGTVTIEGDTAKVPWTDTCAAGTCRLVVSVAPNDTIVLNYTIQGDSVMYSRAQPYADTSLVKGAMLMENGVGRISGGQLNGNAKVTLADRPDSVVQRFSFTATKNP
jgi:hypothetical protein